MRLLIDTHVVVWWDRQMEAIRRPLLSAVRDPQNDIFVSAATIWEIAIKRASGKLSFAGEIVGVVVGYGFSILSISGAHAHYAGGLPHHHRDPFDRMLVAQAALEGMVLGTQDPLMRPYGVAILGLERG
jgi:PIN domain nuclease of toxin-antitoxin system